MPRSRLLLTFAVVLAALLAAVWLVLPATRRAHATFVAHSDPTRAAVAGTVVDPEGKPVAGVTVTWFAAEGDATGPLATRTFVGGGEHAITAADGVFRFAQTPCFDGFAAIDGQSARWEGKTGEVTPRQGFIAGELVLVAQPIPSTRLLHGTLHDPDGKPLQFAPILAKGSHWLRNWQNLVVTDADGRFELVWPWAGEFELTWRPEGAAEQSLGNATCGESTFTVPRVR